MRAETEASTLDGAALGTALRAVRKHRGLRQAQLADALRISRRTYVDLEAGSGRMPLEQLVAFADVTSSDRFALFAAVVFGRPSLAVHCADNKLMTIMMIAADDLEKMSGERLKDVRPQELMRAMEDAFRSLAQDLQQRQINDARLTQRQAKPGPHGGR